MFFIRIQEDLERASKAIYFIRKVAGEREIARFQQLMWEKYEPFARVEPSFVFDMEEYWPQDPLQLLVDALCDAGYVPHQTSNQQELKALREHLQDLRTLLFSSSMNRLPSAKAP